jgi:hypothetical protein
VAVDRRQNRRANPPSFGLSEEPTRFAALTRRSNKRSSPHEARPVGGVPAGALTARGADQYRGGAGGGGSPSGRQTPIGSVPESVRIH